jgi:hypothetical protein
MGLFQIFAEVIEFEATEARFLDPVHGRVFRLSLIEPTDEDMIPVTHGHVRDVEVSRRKHPACGDLPVHLFIVEKGHHAGPVDDTVCWNTRAGQLT